MDYKPFQINKDLSYKRKLRKILINELKAFERKRLSFRGISSKDSK